MGALDRWDPEIADGRDFLAFLVPTARGAMLHYYRDHSWTMRYPRGVKDLASQVAQESERIAQALGRAPRPSEIALALRVDIDVVVDVPSAQLNHQIASLDGVAADEAPLGERLGADDRAIADVDDRDAIERFRRAFRSGRRS